MAFESFFGQQVLQAINRWRNGRIVGFWMVIGKYRMSIILKFHGVYFKHTMGSHSSSIWLCQFNLRILRVFFSGKSPLDNNQIVERSKNRINSVAL